MVKGVSSGKYKFQRERVEEYYYPIDNFHARNQLTGFGS
jgi:hypothetical protein